MTFISDDIRYIGVNDRITDLFEGQYPVPNGIAYNSYVIFDEKIAVMDTVDKKFTDKWLENLDTVLDGRRPDYLVVQHMEPDHSSNIADFLSAYPETIVVASAKAFTMMQNFYGIVPENNKLAVAEGTELQLGNHTLKFITAPMVHWPEVIVTYDMTDKVLFSADAFGKFGTTDCDEEWLPEAKRYYFGIVGKYGVQVQALIKKAAQLEIKTICPLHGPVLKEDVGQYVSIYNTWSGYEPDTEGVLIAYTSVYGNTRNAVELLKEKLLEHGAKNVLTIDLARTDVSYAVAEAFAYNKLVLATTTYNADVFPFMRSFIEALTERGFKKRTVALIENGSWAPMAAKVMTELLSGCKNITFSAASVKIMSAMNDESRRQIEELAKELTISEV